MGNYLYIRNIMEDDPLLTLKQVKSMLGVSTRTIQRWDRDGKIKCTRTVGGMRRVHLSEVQRLLKLGEKHEKSE